MSNRFSLPTPEDFSFRTAVSGHGWYDLLPFEYDAEQARLSYAYLSPTSKMPIYMIVSDSDNGSLTVRSGDKIVKKEAAAIISHVLRMDEDLGEFYTAVRHEDGFEWIEDARAGRLLRSATVWEDLVKTMCTTNCSWGLTRSMVRNLVESLGMASSSGKRAFPTASSIAGCSEQFLRDEIRAGYRSPYLLELAARVAEGKLDPEEWLGCGLETPDLKKEILKIKGIGNYAAENLLKLLGRYDGLALDSWLRAGFYRKYNREKVCPDKKIEKRYNCFGKWKGLAIWCDMTRDWHLTDA